MPENEQKRILTEIKPTAEAEVVNFVLQRFNSAEKHRKVLTEKWDRFYQLYRCYQEEKERKWVSNLVIPTAFVVIETLMPRILSAIFTPKFAIQIIGREKDDEKSAKLVENLLQYQFETMSAFPKFYTWIKNCLMYGTGVLKVFWRFQATKRVVTEKEYLFGIKIGYKNVEKEIIDYDCVDIEVVDLYDFFVDPRATTINDAKWCIHRVWRDYDYLVKKQEEGFYKNIDLVKPGVGMLQEQTKQVRSSISGYPSELVDTDKYKVELLEYWEDDRVIVLANRNVVIRDEQNPFWHRQKPFVVIKDVDLPHEFYGIGEIEPIESLIHERTELRNQALDNVKNIVNKKIVANRNADIDFDRLDEDNRPGGVILTDDINALRYLEETLIAPDLYKQDTMLIKDIQDATAMAEWTIGVSPPRQETATAIVALQQSAMTRFTLKTQNIVNTGIIPLIKMMIALNQQFLGKKQTIRILGEKGFEYPEIDASNISGNYDYISNVGLMEITKDIERNQLLLLANNPLFTLPNVNIEEIQKELLDRFGFKDPDRFIKPMEEIQQTQIPQARGQVEGLLKEGQRPAMKQSPGIPSIAGVPGVPVPRP